MVDDCPTISYLSQKLETIPLTDYFFKKRQDHSIVDKALFRTKSSTVNSSKTAWKFDFAKTFLNDNTNKEFSRQHVTSGTILKTTHRNIKCDDGEQTAKIDEGIGDNSNIVIALTTNQNTILSDGTVESEKHFKRNIKSFSPVFSETLPTESYLKKSPIKRKRSSDEFLYGDASFSKSCDLQVMKNEFCDIQRTLSFDEELLRYDEEIATFTSRSISTSSLRHNYRPSIRLTCRSQPSTLENFRLVHPKVRKVKMLQTASENILENKAEMYDRKMVTSSCQGHNASKMETTTTSCFQPINLPPGE